MILYEGDNELNVQMIPILPPMANLYGAITDAETGAPLAGVKVAISQPGVIIGERYTDSGGYYLFEGLAPGEYNVVFSKDGYETEVR